MSIRGYFQSVQQFHNDRAAVAGADSAAEIAGIVSEAAARNDSEDAIHQPAMDQLRVDAQLRLAALGLEAIGLAAIDRKMNALSAKVERALLDLALNGSRSMTAMSILDAQETAQSLAEDVKQLPQDQLAETPALAQLAAEGPVGALLETGVDAHGLDAEQLNDTLNAVAGELTSVQQDLAAAGIDHMRRQDAETVAAIIGPEHGGEPAKPAGPVR